MALPSLWEKDFYLESDTYGNVYAELYIKAVSGTVSFSIKVTDSNDDTAITTKETTNTNWVKWTGDDRLSVDCSTLVSGEAKFEWIVEGNGQVKNMYVYQQSSSGGKIDHIHTQMTEDLTEFNYTSPS